MFAFSGCLQHGPWWPALGPFEDGAAFAEDLGLDLPLSPCFRNGRTVIALVVLAIIKSHWFSHGG